MDETNLIYYMCSKGGGFTMKYLRNTSTYLCTVNYSSRSKMTRYFLGYLLTSTFQSANLITSYLHTYQPRVYLEYNLHILDARNHSRRLLIQWGCDGSGAARL